MAKLRTTPKKVPCGLSCLVRVHSRLELRARTHPRWYREPISGRPRFHFAASSQVSPGWFGLDFLNWLNPPLLNHTTGLSKTTNWKAAISSPGAPHSLVDTATTATSHGTGRARLPGVDPLEGACFWVFWKKRVDATPPRLLFGGNGCGSKSEIRGYAGFSLWFHLPKCHLGMAQNSRARVTRLLVFGSIYQGAILVPLL